MTPLDRVLALLDCQKSGSGFMAKCPAHDDNKPSLSINVGHGGKVLLRCHAGCRAEKIVSKLGLTLADLFPQNGNGAKRIVAVYDYPDEHGDLLFQVVRFDPKDFKQRRPDGNGGWVWNLKGVRRVLYRLPQILKAETVYVVEGEKDADRLWSLGFPATTSPHGAGKWREEYSQTLAGKRIVILPDNDESGEQHTLQVARSLLPIAEAVKIVRLPGLPPKGDVSDWLDAGHTKEELAAIVQTTPILRPEDLQSEQKARDSGLPLTSLNDLLNEPEEQLDWLVEDRLPASGFSLLVAKPKVGKTTLARHLSLTVSRGHPFLGSSTQQGPVIYLALEEKRSEIKKHFRDMGATGEEEISIFAAAAPTDALRQIRTVAEEKKPALIVVDPLFKLARIKDGNDYAQVTAALEPLLVLARETGAHVLCVHHAGKGEREGGDSILGSTAIFAAVDTVILLKRTERYRTISTIQRYGEDLPETILRFDSATRTLSLGASKEEEELRRIAEAIIACLKVQEEDRKKGHPLTQAALDEEIEGKTVYKRKALKALVDGKQIERIGKGGKKDPYCYAVKDSRFCCSFHSNGNMGTRTEEEDSSSQEDSRFCCSRNFAQGSCSQGSERAADFCDLGGFDWQGGEQQEEGEL